MYGEDEERKSEMVELGFARVAILGRDNGGVEFDTGLVDEEEVGSGGEERES